MRTIFGLEAPTSGQLHIKGQQVRQFSAANGVAAGVGYVPRERKIEGIVAGMTVFENITLSQLAKFSSGGVLRIGAEKSLAKDWVNRLEIKTPSVQANAGKLSGGNQQKVVLSKWRSGGSDVILLDHPTRGVDVGAKENIYAMVRSMCDDGCGVLLMADTLEEAIGLSHTIAVIKDGRIQKWFECKPGAKPSLFDLVHYMT
jgi:ribose transport system ATP-binding protein